MMQLDANSKSAGAHLEPQAAGCKPGIYRLARDTVYAPLTPA
jgi:hypothetical protein